MTDAAPLMLTPRQTAERLGVGLGTLRKHAASLEALTGAPLPRGEHLERLWPESLVSMLGEALDMVRRHEAASVGGALEALRHPAALGARAPQTPPSRRLLDGPEALRQLIRDEVRAAVHEAVQGHGPWWNCAPCWPRCRLCCLLRRMPTPCAWLCVRSWPDCGHSPRFDACARATTGRWKASGVEAGKRGVTARRGPFPAR